jgi:cyclic dehypoxanthinyl futalosine synthase
VTYDVAKDELQEKVWQGARIDQNEALQLSRLPLDELGALADRRRNSIRQRAHGGRGAEVVTYIVDRNINYTNVCNVYCKFCAFYRTEKDADSYVITHEELDRKIEETMALGGTQILMQGGHHPKLTKQWYLDLLAHVRGKYPLINIRNSLMNPWRISSVISLKPAWGLCQVGAGKSWWIEFAAGSRRSRR